MCSRTFGQNRDFREDHALCTQCPGCRVAGTRVVGGPRTAWHGAACCAPQAHACARCSSATTPEIRLLRQHYRSPEIRVYSAASYFRRTLTGVKSALRQPHIQPRNMSTHAPRLCRPLFARFRSHDSRGPEPQKRPSLANNKATHNSRFSLQLLKLVATLFLRQGGRRQRKRPSASSRVSLRDPNQRPAHCTRSLPALNRTSRTTPTPASNISCSQFSARVANLRFGADTAHRSQHDR